MLWPTFFICSAIMFAGVLISDAIEVSVATLLYALYHDQETREVYNKHDKAEKEEGTR